MITTTHKNWAIGLHNIGGFQDKTQSPEGKGFRLKLHETQPGAPLSPFYINLRLIRSSPEVWQQTVKVLEEMSKFLNFDCVADIPTAITPTVSAYCYVNEIPMVTPRGKKTHGSGAEIDGIYKPGQTALLVDDLVTKAHSKLESAEVLRAGGLKVKDLIIFVDREQGGVPTIEKKGIKVHTAFTLSELLKFYLENDMLARKNHEEIVEYVNQS